MQGKHKPGAKVRALNFIVTGQQRCGAAVIQTSVNSHPNAVCHGDLLHSDPQIRRGHHEDYFGKQRDTKVPDWCSQVTSPEQYLTAKIFDNNLHGERAIGVKVLYPVLRENDLWDYFASWCRLGDFCLIHVNRNPLACYVSLKQAERTNVWQQAINDKTTGDQPTPISIDADELISYCRWHAALQRKVHAMCDDRLEISYRELYLNYREVMQEVFSYLELPPYPDVSPGVRRLKNRDIRNRVINFAEARLQVPPDVQAFFDADDLF